MGLFSKKTYTCKQCGKEYEAQLNLSGNLCKDCLQKKKEVKKTVSGYVEYGMTTGRSYNIDELRSIAKHRDDILEKYRIHDSITRNDLEEAGDNYRKLTENEAINIYKKVIRSSLVTTLGATLASDFFCLTTFDGVIVDFADVFAVGYTSDRRSSSISQETILCAIFTNDPYIPVFPVVHSGNIGFFSLQLKSKQGRQVVESLYTRICPNLAYPVTDLKKLKKMVKQEGAKGNIDTSPMLNYISNASSCSGIFNTKDMSSTLSTNSINKMASYGYIPFDEVSYLLKLDKMFSSKYWKGIAQKATHEFQYHTR